MSVEAIALVMHHGRAKGTDMVVLIGIANHDGDGGSWPTVETLAKYANVTERNVQKSLARLASKQCTEDCPRSCRAHLPEIRIHLQDGGRRDTPDWKRPNRYEVLVKCPPTCDGTTKHRDLSEAIADASAAADAADQAADEALFDVDDDTPDPAVDNPSDTTPDRTSETTPPVADDRGAGVASDGGTGVADDTQTIPTTTPTTVHRSGRPPASTTGPRATLRPASLDEDHRRHQAAAEARAAIAASRTNRQGARP